jgi:hypothetical protein
VKYISGLSELGITLLRVIYCLLQGQSGEKASSLPAAAVKKQVFLCPKTAAENELSK